MGKRLIVILTALLFNCVAGAALGSAVTYLIRCHLSPLRSGRAVKYKISERFTHNQFIINPNL